MNITGYNSYSSCRFCNIQEIYSKQHNHVYYHPKPKGTYTKKNHLDWLKHIDEIENTISSKEKEILIQKFGKIIYIFKHYYYK